MIVVVGEALVDLVVAVDGTVTSALGGAPFNTARACGRLGAEVHFVGPVSDDRFGQLLTEQLVADRVGIDMISRCDVPTTLAVAELDASGAAIYRFYMQATSIAQPWEPPSGSAWRDAEVLYTGGLALAVEPLAIGVERALTAAADHTTVMIDVNARPAAVTDRQAYLTRLERVLVTADVVKVSDEDLAYMAPGDPPIDAGRRLLAKGPQAVLLTTGGEGVRVLTPEGELHVAVQPVPVVDTIGAGDTFSAGFVTWWTAAGFGTPDLARLDRVVCAVEAGCTLAGVVCTRRGADPPWRSELPPAWWPAPRP